MSAATMRTEDKTLTGVPAVLDYHHPELAPFLELHLPQHMNTDALENQNVVAHLTLTDTAGAIGELGITAKLPVREIDITVESSSLSDSVGGGAEDLRDSETLGVQSCRVTFRPRVRITSGLTRLRQSASYQSQNDHPWLLSTASSSRSCSPSSSISAPLRFHSEELVPKPGWGTLGQRVSILARRGEHKRNFRKRMMQHERMLKSFQGTPSLPASLQTGAGFTETSPLLMTRSVCQCGMAGCEYDERRIALEIDTLFGTWPKRLWNPKWWWWWHIQPIVFCRCLDDPEEDF